MVRGRVVAFDDARGLGEIELRDGTRVPFHCTAIADGSRSIAAAAEVECTIVAGPLGGREAGQIVAIT